MSSTTTKEQQRTDSVESGTQRIWRKTYASVGFNKGYNFPLWIIFAGAMVGFCLARSSYLNIITYSEQAAPGEWYWYSNGVYKIAIIMHLATVIPGGLLLVWQFVPIIRKKALLFHRINGYTVIILLIFGVISALMLARRSFGGAPATQAAIGLLAILVVGSLGMAYYNIKCLQVDQHRAWMLRAAFYCGTIITMRLIMIIGAQILPLTGDYYTTMSCDALATLVGSHQISKNYPQCIAPDSNASTMVPVLASFTESSATVATALELNFSMWLSIFIHLIGVEIYLNLTSKESERLRMVSYERQMEAGYTHPGSAGLTSDRWGDVRTWTPLARKEEPEHV